MERQSIGSSSGEDVTPPTAPAISPPAVSGESYKPQLDGLRALCIIFTIFNHIPGRPQFINGSVGVDVFFALSGWLITWLLQRELQRTGDIDLAGFYIRRIFRIVPLYLITVTLYVVLVLVGLKSSGVQELKVSWPFMLAFCMEYRPASEGTLFGQAWTLGIEEKFYLIWPLIVASTTRKPFLSALAGLGVVAFILVAFGPSSYIVRGYLGLGAGSAAAMIVARYPSLAQWLRRHSIAGLMIAAMAIPYALSIVHPLPGIWNVLIAILGVGLVASLWFAESSPISRVLSFGPLAWAGRLTYAIYLIQAIMIKFAQLLLNKLHLPSQGMSVFFLSYLLCIAAAALLHVTIETRLIRVGKRLSSRIKGREIGRLWRHERSLG